MPCVPQHGGQEATARIDCLVSTYASHVGEWHDDRWQQLRLFLTSALSVHTSGTPSGALTDGFERFYSLRAKDRIDLRKNHPRLYRAILRLHKKHTRKR